MFSRLKQLSGRFLPDAAILKVVPFGSGHINDTYKVESTEGTFLLQRVNHEIFKDVQGLTNNLVAVTTFLQKSLETAGGPMQALQSIPNSGGAHIVKADEDGTHWRMFHFIGNSYSYDRVENDTQAYEGGRAYGWFVRLLDDFPADRLVETIPGFHAAGSRIDVFRKAVEEDRAGRVKEAAGLVESLLERVPEMMSLFNLEKAGRLPVRVTHNDTKINNVLFNAEGQGICVIDLDTVMPGIVHFDFGDAIRTFTNTGEEDDRQLEKVGMNLVYFEAFSRGFLSETRHILKPEELETLAFGAKYITYEQSIRFLTDYLQGDTYYKIQYPGHNLVRARAQEKLLRSMEDQFESMQAVIQKYA